MTQKLLAPIVAVLVENEGDGYTEYTVQTGNQDFVRWDLERHKNSWPDRADAPMLWLTVMAWAALRRSKEIAMPVTEFLDRCAQVKAVQRDGTDLTADSIESESLVDPTQPDHDSGS